MNQKIKKLGKNILILKFYGFNKKAKFLCKCGKVFFSPASSVVYKSGHTVSCGCHRRLRMTKINQKMNVCKYIINEKYFNKINSKDRAYFLGLLFADGWISNNERGGNRKKYHKVGLSLLKSDIGIIKLFKKYSHSNHPILKYKSKLGSKMCNITINSAVMMNNLINNGCIPRKSLILKFPKKVPKNLLSHFIRGYFDGDGSVSKYKSGLKFSIAGTFDVVSKIQNILVKTLNISKNKINKNGKIYIAEWAKQENLIKMAKYLYSDSNGICLKRKRDIFKSLWSKQ